MTSPTRPHATLALIGGKGGGSWLLTAALMACPGAATATGDPVAGERKSVACHACHGKDGISIHDLWPNLAGQRAGYLRKQLKAFRDGQRKDPIMQPLVESLSDQDIADIAAYYSGRSGGETPPPGRH